MEGKITDILSKLEKLMEGGNYLAEFGVEIFDNCETIDKFQDKIEERHNSNSFKKFTPTLIDTYTFWKKIDGALVYRGDESAGLSLNETEEKELLLEQSALKDSIKEYLFDSTKIYEYPEEVGVTGYIVYWAFIFLLLNTDKQSVLIYGSASD